MKPKPYGTRRAECSVQHVRLETTSEMDALGLSVATGESLEMPGRPNHIRVLVGNSNGANLVDGMNHQVFNQHVQRSESAPITCKPVLETEVQQAALASLNTSPLPRACVGACDFWIVSTSVNSLCGDFPQIRDSGIARAVHLLNHERKAVGSRSEIGETKLPQGRYSAPFRAGRSRKTTQREVAL